jgi:23S rRNA (cytosine1962-C5)-methyltransferase
MLVSNDWNEYKVIKASKGEKLEVWGKYTLLRPDPVVTWDMGEFNYSKINAKYIRSNKGGGYWENLSNVPSSWVISYKDLKFNIKQMGFKHTGLFPEQAINWDYASNKIKNSNRKNIKVLNLFAYTGAMSVACLKSGAEVVHVDSSRGMIDWAKENVKLNNLEDKPIRFLVDDVLKFVKREIRRGNKYDAIIMDPPSYGRGANGEVWSLDENLEELIKLTKEILKDDFLFFIVNTYSTNLPNVSLENILKINFPKSNILVDDLCLPIKDSNLYLSCGITGRVENE